MEAQVLTHPTFNGENPAMIDIDPALQMAMPMQQFETLSVESFGSAEAVEALSKTITAQNLAAEAMNEEALSHQNQINMINAFTRSQAERFYHDEEEKRRKVAA